ncbi:MAG TPA: hypothetical protein V6C86_20630 [Oculatellaceae cyanobacterium]|jgi:hypothetical protein
MNPVRNESGTKRIRYEMNPVRNESGTKRYRYEMTPSTWYQMTPGTIDTQYEMIPRLQVTPAFSALKVLDAV